VLSRAKASARSNTAAKIGNARGCDAGCPGSGETVGKIITAKTPLLGTGLYRLKTLNASQRNSKRVRSVG